MLALQRSAGNQAVTALIQRAPAPTPAALTKLQQLLDDDKEEAAIAQMGTLTEDEAKAALDLPHLRKLAVKSFNDAEMARGIASLKGGTLLQKLRWMIAEDVTDLARVWPLLVDKSVPANEKTALYPQNDVRSYFIEICNDDEMASVVDVLGGTLVQKLHWMLLEGTSWGAVIEKLNKHTSKEEREKVYEFAPMRGLFVDLLGDAQMAALVQALGGTLDQQLSWMAAEGTNGGLVFAKVRQAPDDQLAKVTDVTRKAIKKEISEDDYKRFIEMLDEQLVTWEQKNFKTKEQHYELADENDPSKGWELKKDFEWRTKYEILYRRDELRVRVRIKLKGESAGEAHKKIWRDGIANRWNNKFHIENDHRLALVFEPIFTDSNPHCEIELHKPPIVRENSSNWYVGPTANADPSKPPDTTTGDTAAHEFGHLVGLEDEYRLTKSEFKRLVGRDPTVADQDPDIGYTVSRLMSAGPGRRRGAPPEAVHRLAEREQAQRREAVQAGRRAVTDLLVSFAAAGGAPPASQELVRVFRDGRVRALAGTAWPGLGRVDEAGAYAFELDAGALGELERLAEAAAGEELDGPREPGSGRFALDVGDDARLRWDPFTTPPEPVAALADRLRALLVEARAHPLAAVRLEVEAARA